MRGVRDVVVDESGGGRGDAGPIGLVAGVDFFVAGGRGVVPGLQRKSERADQTQDQSRHHPEHAAHDALFRRANLRN